MKNSGRKTDRGEETGASKNKINKRENSNKDSGSLLKLFISQFKGTHTDHFRFWNQFETKIDKSKVTKLSYLKEMIIPKV